MITLVTFLKRGPHFTRNEFVERWLTVHAPIAATFPGLRGYTLTFSLETGEPAADGIAQLWFDDRDAAQSSYASDIGRNGSADANAHLSRRQHMLISEQVRGAEAWPGSARYKVLVAVKRAPGQSRGDFVRSWPEAARALFPQGQQERLRITVDEAGKLLNSGTTGTLGLIAGEGVFDGMAELWLDSEEAARSAFKALQQLAPRHFPNSSVVETALLQEHIVLAPPAAAPVTIAEAS